MKPLRLLALALAIYVAAVAAFEGLVTTLGRLDAGKPRRSNDAYVTLTTRDDGGQTHDTVVAAVKVDGALYVAANHWPRAWYRRALAHPEVILRREAERRELRAVPVTGDELTRVRAAYALPLAIRVLTGFPPRRFLRLDPR